MVSLVDLKGWKIMQPIIDAKDIWFRYTEEDNWVLHGIDFQLFQGEWVTILGGNGSGKSTFAKLLNGLLVPTKGEIHVFGKVAKTDDELWHVRQQVGMVFQNPENQIVAMTVEDDVAFGLENLGVEPDEMEKRIDQVLTQIGLIEFRSREPHKLSGGQKQRLAIAGVLAMRPQVIIFDESTSMLDPQGSADVLQVMQQLKSQGISIIHITHEMDEVYYSDRILVFNRGVISIEGNLREVMTDATLLSKAGLVPPFTVRVRDRLLSEGARIDATIMTEEELVGELWTSLLEK